MKLWMRVHILKSALFSINAAWPFQVFREFCYFISNFKPHWGFWFSKVFISVVFNPLQFPLFYSWINNSAAIKKSFLSRR